jgi:bifunctional non-homologous end joining protein LigD
MDELVAVLDEHGLEGIVVKRKDSTYLEGKEPGTWIKYRLYEIDEFVIGGYLKRKDPLFDALIVGQYEGERLIYKEKVRFGFDDEKKQRLLKLMRPREIPDSPFSNLPERKRRGALDREHWLRRSGCAPNCVAPWNIRRKPRAATSAATAASES